MCLRLTQKAIQLTFFYFSFSTVILDRLAKVFYLCFVDCYQRRVWLFPEKSQCTQISCVKILHVCALEKIIMVDISGLYCHECNIPHLSQDYSICRNTSISNTTVPSITKIGRMVTYLEGLPLIKSNDLLIT